MPENKDALELCQLPSPIRLLQIIYITVKKRILSGCTLLLGTATVFPQGTVNFNNNGLIAGNPPSVLVYLAPGFPLVGTNWVAQLYYGAPGSSEVSLIPVATPPAPFREPTTSLPGTWKGGTRTLIGFYNNGGPNDPINVELQVRVWDVTQPPPLYTGKSSLFIYTIPAAGSPPAAFSMSGFVGFTLIPEPSTPLLISLGLLLALFFKGCVTPERGNELSGSKVGNEPIQAAHFIKKEC